MTNKSIRDYINLIENIQQEVTEGTDREVTHNGEVIGHTWNQGNEVHGEHSKSGASWAGGNHASMAQHLKNHHDSWVKDQARKQSLKKQGVAEGLPQTLRKVVPGYAKREIDKKMDAGKFGKTDADKDANFQRYKKIQDKIKDQGVAEEQLEETSPEAIDKINQITRK